MFDSFAGFGNLSLHLKLGFVSVLIYASSRRFHQVGMKKCQLELKRWRLSWIQEAMQGMQDFRYALRKFCKDCENFATIAKISQSLRNFAMIAKFLYHRENSLS